MGRPRRRCSGECPGMGPAPCTVRVGGCAAGRSVSGCSGGAVSCRMIMDRAFLWRSACAWLRESHSSGSRGSAPGLKLDRARPSPRAGGGGGRKDGGGPESRMYREDMEEAEGGGGGAV